ncbi:MFS transporter [Thermoflexus sp.]|uniref:MFS transporter n=1 Tax=Thermoflexus sp. TaxID=1969742 RepID=UPI0025E50A20|nr:MFS transporter [Thermoflexus sp.]MCS6962701.1 MFS transporter [Thermoflexus sp.]MCX7691622.1 MFS transporter [Thermoflexus sp.]MDW8185516.1 MFS transporter [Anaerolineae bacterium]
MRIWRDWRTRSARFRASLLSPEGTPDPHLRRNFTVGVVNGALFIFAETILDPYLVLAWFLSRLQASNLLVALVAPMRDGLWFLPQLFVSRWMRHRVYYMDVYRQMALVRALGAFAMALGVWLAAPHPTGMLLAFFIPYFLISLASGISGLPFMEIVGKTIPPRQRGVFFAARLFFGGLLGLAASGMVRLLLEEQAGLAFPHNVAVLFLIFAIFTSIGMAAFAMVVEPPSPVPDGHAPPAPWREAIRGLWRRTPYRLFLGARVALMWAAIAAPFFTAYAVRDLRVPDATIGLYLGFNVGASLLSNLLWSWLSVRWGHRAVLEGAALTGMLSALWALMVEPLSRLGPDLAAGLMLPAFALSGAYASGAAIGGMSLLLEIAPGHDRPLTIGLTNTLLGIALLSTSLGGLIADFIGYRGLFALSFGFYTLALVLLWGLRRAMEREPSPKRSIAGPS